MTAHGHHGHPSVERRVVRHPDGPVLASAAAARLVTELVDVLELREVAHLVLTGGTIGIGTLAALAQLPADRKSVV